MKSLNSLKKDNKAVFGLTSVQQFFAIILGVALLAYVIVVIMGTLGQSNIIPQSTLSQLVRNESSWLNGTGDFVNNAGVAGFSNPTGLIAINGSSGAIIQALNYSITSAGFFNNTLAGNTVVWANVNLTYTYSYNDNNVNGANAILANTSNGISSFFSAISPVYAILAILVIILVLVVLVRVVTGGNAGGSQRAEPQL